jgi:hypothetical protein
MQRDSDTYISQALEEFVTETQAQYDAALAHKADDDMKDEIAFWKAQRNAFVKAQHHFARGVRLNETPSGYTVASASRPDSIHRLYKIGDVGDIWTCSCEAGERGVFHWHTALVAGYERGAQLVPGQLIEVPSWAAEEDAQLIELMAA